MFFGTVRSASRSRSQARRILTTLRASPLRENKREYPCSVPSGIRCGSPYMRFSPQKCKGRENGMPARSSVAPSRPPKNLTRPSPNSDHGFTGETNTKERTSCGFAAAKNWAIPPPQDEPTRSTCPRPSSPRKPRRCSAWATMPNSPSRGASDSPHPGRSTA